MSVFKRLSNVFQRTINEDPDGNQTAPDQPEKQTGATAAEADTDQASDADPSE